MPLSLSYDANITITVQLQASGGLSKRDIERMLKEAQEQKEQDEK